MFSILFGMMTTQLNVPPTLKSLSFSTFPTLPLALVGSQPFPVLASQNLHWYALISLTALTSVSRSKFTCLTPLSFKALMVPLKPT